jgi:hypothetical protein
VRVPGDIGETAAVDNQAGVFDLFGWRVAVCVAFQGCQVKVEDAGEVGQPEPGRSLTSFPAGHVVTGERGVTGGVGDLS